MIYGSANSNAGFLRIDNAIFFDIIGDEISNLFHIEGENILMSFESVQITLVGFFSNVFYIASKNGNFSINSSIFLENYPIKNVLSLNSLFFANISNTTINYTNNPKGERFLEGGGNILLRDCLMKTIDSLEICYSFSSTTTFGIKMVDHAENKIIENPYVNNIVMKIV